MGVLASQPREATTSEWMLSRTSQLQAALARPGADPITPRTLTRCVFLRLAAALAVLALGALTAAAPVLAEGITYAHDDLRDGWYPGQSSLTPQLEGPLT